MECNSVDRYIKSYPDDIQFILRKIRKTIVDNAPNVKEEINCGIPVYKTNRKVFLYFSVVNNSIFIYLTPVRYTEFPTEITEHKHPKDSLRFSTDKPIHYELIGQMIKNRVKHYNQKVLI
jgi:uncharacterized protein YdhG (YjbR/CyaY superfamily)